jgi:D-alanine-D-alanine ligase
MKKNVAIIAGGYSSEFEVSIRSAENLYAFIDKEKYNAYVIVLTKDAWEVKTGEAGEIGVRGQGSDVRRGETGETEEKNQLFSYSVIQLFNKIGEIDKNNFSFRQGNKTILFDFAYITIHGTPGEDGLLQGYFDMLRIPYSTCGVLTSALTFNKHTCNQFLKSYHILVADSILIRKGHPVYPEQVVEKLGLPVFLKPNNSGSSFGITKVHQASQIQTAVEKAFLEGSGALIERFIPGIELTCGCYRSGANIIALPVTEVVPDNEFFDYDAKYNGEVQEITPARIPAALTDKIQRETEKIYELIGAKGIIRIDYIVPLDEIPVLLEINTTPGMTATSFIPQQVQAAGLNMTGIMTEIIENG